MDMTIRLATPNDAAAIAPLIYDAIGDIAHRLTGETNKDTAIAALAELVTQTNNRHSYLYTYVAEHEQAVVGIAVLYDGRQGRALDLQLEQWLYEKHRTRLTIDVEAHDDEFYIDTVCVAAHARGLGVGTKLLQFAEQLAYNNNYTKIALNVEVQKVQARKLYERLGYERTEAWTIIDEPFDHMVKAL